MFKYTHRRHNSVQSILLILLKKKQLNQSGLDPGAMKTANFAGNATEDYSWVCGFHEPSF